MYVQNGTFRIAESAKRRGKKVTCEHWPIHFGSDDFSIAWGESTRDLLDGSPLKSDFFKVGVLYVYSRSFCSLPSTWCLLLELIPRALIGSLNKYCGMHNEVVS